MELLGAVAQDRPRSVGPVVDDRNDVGQSHLYRVPHGDIVDDGSAPDDKSHPVRVHLLDQHPVEDDLAGVVPDIENVVRRIDGKSQRVERSVFERPREALRDGPLEALLVDVRRDPEIYDIARDGQTNGGAERIVGLGDHILEPRVQGERQRVETVLDLAVGVLPTRRLPDDPVDHLPHRGRRVVHVHLGDGFRHRPKHAGVRLGVVARHSSGAKSLFQEAGNAVQECLQVASRKPR